MIDKYSEVDRWVVIKPNWRAALCKCKITKKKAASKSS